MQDTVQVQLERQEVATHSHLHRAPNAAKAEAWDIRVWCRQCRLDVTKRIEYSCRYEVATGKYIAWLHVCRQCCSGTSKNKYPQQHFIPVNLRIPFVLYHSMTDRERKIRQVARKAKQSEKLTNLSRIHSTIR